MNTYRRPDYYTKSKAFAWVENLIFTANFIKQDYHYIYFIDKVTKPQHRQ